MSAEWVTAISGLLTFVVIAASALVALFQLRHMRGSTQVSALSELRETMQAADFQAASSYVVHELQMLIADEKQRALMMQPVLPVQFNEIRMVANFYESMGAFARYGLIDTVIVCDIWSYVIVRNWNALAPFIHNRRKYMNNPGLFENFEYLAVLATRWEKAHPAGIYPRGMQRMPQTEIWRLDH